MPNFGEEAPDSLMVPEGVMSGYDIPAWATKKKKWFKQTVPHEYLEGRLSHLESNGATVFAILQHSQHELLIVYYDYR